MDAASRAAERLGSVEHHAGYDHTLAVPLRALADWLARPHAGDGSGHSESLQPLSDLHIAAFRAEFLRAVAQGGASRALSAQEVARTLMDLETVPRYRGADPTRDFAEQLSSAHGVETVLQIAHDMRSPLSSILFLVQSVRDGNSGPVNAIQERQLGLVYGAALGLSGMSADLIDGMRGQRLVDGQPAPFSIADTMSGVRELVGPICEEKQVPIRVIEPLPDGRLGYASALSRVLLNLTTNALRCTDDGQVTIAASSARDWMVDFWVEDTGHGLPAEIQSSLSTNGGRPRYSKAGLGLAICRELLDEMGSSLTVASSERGTKFSFRLHLPPASK